MNYASLFFSLLVLTSVKTYSQNIYSLSGQVVDKEKQAVASGDATLLSSRDSSVVSKTFITQGSFLFEPTKQGEYFLKISALGFENKFQMVNLDESKTIVVVLEAAPAVLKEVTIVGSKKPFSYKDGNIIVNVERSALSAISDPVNLLSKLPTVQMSPDGESLNIVGKGQPLIYIDNQKMTLNDLKSLSVADIKTIEIINNPSSKYEAEARSVIRIMTKMNKKEGWKAEFSQTAAYRKYYLNRSSANINVRKKKLELKGSFQFNRLETWEGNDFDFRISNLNIISRYSVTAVTTRPQFIAGAGAFYQINEEDYLSVNTNIRSQKESFPIYTNSYLKNAALEENVFTSNINQQPNLYYSSNLNYNKNLKKIDGTLFIGIQHTGYKEDLTSSINNSYNNAAPILSQNRRQHALISVVTGRADLEKKFKKDIRWELGGNISYAASSGHSAIENYNPEEELHPAFEYDEKNYAAYTQISGKLNKIGYSGGLRMENTNVRSGYSDDISESEINKHYTQFFPKASVSIPVDSLKTVTLKYSKSITRPNYTNANQTSVYINPYFEWANNINLNPSITREVSATMQYKDYSLAVGWYQVKGAVYSSFDYDAQQIRLRRTDINYDQESGVFVHLTIPFKYKLWSSTNVMNTMYNTIKDASATTGRSRPYFYYYSSNEFKLPKDFVFTVSGWAITKSYQGTFERNALFSVDTSLTKTIFKNMVCTVRFNNMFRSINSEEKFAVNDVAANGVYYDNSREFSVGLKYSLGKLKDTRFRNKDVDENTNRVR